MEKRKDHGAILIPAGLLLGMGFGFIFSNIPTGLFIGLGAGMAAWAIIKLVQK